jgi:hypothetical protein
MKTDRPTQGKNARKPSNVIIAKRYLDLQRLRDEVRKVEISRGKDVVNAKRTSVRNPGD